MRNTPSNKPVPAFSDLPARLASGAAYIIVSVLAIALGEVSFLIYAMATAAVCSYEWSRLGTTNRALPAAGAIVSAVFPAALYFLGFSGLLISIVLVLAATAAFYALTPGNVIFSAISKTITSSLYIASALCCCMLLYPLGSTSIASVPIHGSAVLALFASMWIADGAAYLMGVRFGCHKLVPRISPKKSVEGTVAGITASCAVWALFSLSPGFPVSMPAATAIGLACGVAGVVGDLAESKLKRSAGAKDSGSLMPGHGGLLDRTDSLLLAAPVAMILMAVLGAIPIPA